MQCAQTERKKEFSFQPKQSIPIAKISETPTLRHKGIGPIADLSLDHALDSLMVMAGKKLYEVKCTTCHQVGKTFIGPAPDGVLKRRSPEWIMNLLLNTEEMLQKDSVAKLLFMEFNGQLMTNQQLTESEARAILEYLRMLN